MLVEGRPKMAPATTEPEAGSGGLHAASRSDLGEKQPFKQDACLPAKRGEPVPALALNIVSLI